MTTTSLKPSSNSPIDEYQAITPNAEVRLQMGRPGALVISLDFELHWGVRDHVPLNDAERARLLAARAGIPRMLDLFEEFSVHATWAVVGFLFARSRDEAEAFRPQEQPRYRDDRLNPYREQWGADEKDDPFHFAPSLITQIAQRKGQEIASHSFSHYYSLEDGQTEKEFEADLKSAIAIATNSGYTLRSYVFPRHQCNPRYLAALQRWGIQAYRGNEPLGIKKAVPFTEQRRPYNRIARLLDSYMNICGPLTVAWPDPSGVSSITASRYLRSYHPAFSHLEPYLLRRITKAMKYAAERGEIFHLWWHPEDFATDYDRNLQLLRQVLETFAAYRARYGMASLSMSDVIEKNHLLGSAREHCEIA